MSQPEKKLDKFESAVLKDAQDQRERILREIEEYRKAEMEKAEEDILHEAYIMIQNEIAAIKNQQSRKISLAELDGRRKLLKQREDITEKVFSETAVRVREYASTAEYEMALCEAVRIQAGRLPAGKLIIQVRHEDLRLKDRLIAASGRDAGVEENVNITLGGFILAAPEEGLVIDESLDLKLNSQKDWFAATSGLTLGL